jgi:NTP pyrophosphatase (non-canonical NTP hydrolase)
MDDEIDMRGVAPNNMSMADYVDWVKEHDKVFGFSNEHTTENLLHYALALCEEAGEVGGAVKKWVRGRYNTGYSVSTDELGGKVLEELTDVLIYVGKLLLQLEAMGLVVYPAFEFEDAWRSKFKVLHERWGGRDDCELCK